MLYFIINLPQLERIKTELKRSRYGCSKVQEPIGKDQEFPESQLQDAEGIYKIMYINSRGYEKKIQGGFMCNSGIYPGGILEVCKTHKQIWEIHLFLGGFRAKPVVFFLCWDSPTATNRSRRQRPGGRRARVRREKRRGAEGDLDGGLTGGGGQREAPDFEEGEAWAAGGGTWAARRAGKRGGGG
jgi:hypothetical protein